MTKSLNNLQPVGALLMRLALGVSMAVHGYDKVIPHGALNHYVHYIASLGMPHWLGYVSAYTEFAGGILHQHGRWVWIGVGAALVIALLIWIKKSRRIEASISNPPPSSMIK